MPLLSKALGILPPGLIRAVSRARWKIPLLRRPLEWVADRLRHRDGVITGGVGKGLKFNPGPSHGGYLLGTFEPEVQRLLGGLLRPGMVFHDAGANVGFLSVIAARLVGPGGRVVAWEPLPEAAGAAEHNARLNGFDHLTVRREALGHADGTASFRVFPRSSHGQLASSPFAKPDDPVVSTMTVPVRSLDRLIAEGAVPPPDVFKIDVEGAEGDVMRGAGETIRSARPVLLIELHGTNAEVAALLDGFGYQSVVLGDPRPITSAAWYAYVLAIPAERADLAGLLDESRSHRHAPR